MDTTMRTWPAISAVIGGVLWALTPLRQPILQAGRHPDEGELIFRGYNLLIVLITVLLTLAVLRLRTTPHTGAVFTTGWWTILIGHLLLGAGSLPAVLLGGQAPALVSAALDIGFLGAMLAALGAIPLGAAGIRRRLLPAPAAVLFIAALPAGLLGATVLAAAHVPEDYAGLPLTILYGGAWAYLGTHWLHTHHSPTHSLSS